MRSDVLLRTGLMSLLTQACGEEEDEDEEDELLCNVARGAAQTGLNPCDALKSMNPIQNLSALILDLVRERERDSVRDSGAGCIDPERIPRVGWRHAEAVSRWSALSRLRAGRSLRDVGDAGWINSHRGPIFVPFPEIALTAFITLRL
ncbi:Uncharacterized protein DAT39_015508 [Clarias magur]|uniref:Uncharacterized protein n=1 Tax=Clarias magur TaxID=1594786 RepID=A0A8J4X668_CLAMG|nr:Uncharacterized protein DAT39_015508 [Clarias magur]